jgi:hypothetical protein
MRSVPLSAPTLKLVERQFGQQHRAQAVAALEADCGANLPFMEKGNPESLERIRFAVLKLSEGSVSKLEQAITLAKQDWRDALVAAEFGDDLQAHAAWAREQLGGA